MILTDIHVAALNETYDFRLDENVNVGIIISDIVEILLREIKEEKEGRKIGEGFDLCSYEKKIILPKDKTLAESGIGNGSKLLLV